MLTQVMRNSLHPTLFACLVLHAAPLFASESELEEAPPAKSVEEIEGRVEREFRPPPGPEERALLPGLLDDLPALLRDAYGRRSQRGRGFPRGSCQ
jgi:hypothetical protein